MLKRIYILFFVLALGFSLMPNMSFACEKKSEKKSCEQKMTSSEEKTAACKKECCTQNHDSDKDQHGCNGKCDHTNCTTTATLFSLVTENKFEFTNNLFNFSSEKSVSYHKTASISAGFPSIWLLPKIK
nr:hypothetical protein [uncultured Flavobacterium sp.]